MGTVACTSFTVPWSMCRLLRAFRDVTSDRLDNRLEDLALPNWVSCASVPFGCCDAGFPAWLLKMATATVQLKPTLTRK